MKKRLPWLVLLAAVVAGVAGFLLYQRRHVPPPYTLQTEAVAKRHIVGRVTATGTLLATVTVQVGTQVSGRIQKLLVDYNSEVKKGQLVAKIDPLLYEAALEQSRANYVQAKAQVESAKASAELTAKLYARELQLQKDNLASLQDVETSETNAHVAAANVNVAKANLAQNEAALHQAETNLSYTSIISPIDGVVISRSVDVGQTVAASLAAPTLFTIAEDLHKMQVNTNVSEGDVGRLDVGMVATFTVDAFPGRSFTGKISQIRNAATTLQNVVTYDAVVDVHNDDLKLRPGMTANTTVIYAEKEDVLSVSNAALRFRPPPEMVSPESSASAAERPARPPGDGGAPDEKGEAKAGGAKGKAVWIEKDGLAVSVRVRLGLSDGSYTEVASEALHEGDRVIVDAVASGKGTAGPAGSAARRIFF